MNENEAMSPYSFAEKAIEVMTPLTWSEQQNKLVVDEARLSTDGKRFVWAYVNASAALVCTTLLIADLGAGGWATARMLCVLTACTGVGFAAGAVAIWAARRRRS